MVSPLWKACSDGDLDTVLTILNEPVDLELKDPSGVTALIEAVKSGNVDVVRALLNKGADPNNASSQGRPEQYTSDPAIIELLRSYAPPPPLEQHHDHIYANDDPSKAYYAPPPPPPGAYGYYPPMNQMMPPMGEPGAYYTHQPPQLGDMNAMAGSVGHLPPADVARMIPCRYFPACRYGAQCMFAHPQGPFVPPPPPHAQYPPFDPAMGNPYGYYPPPPPPFQQPNGAPMAPMSPPPMPPHGMHSRSPSEIVAAPAGPFTNGVPPPPGPHGHMSPSPYPPAGPVPVPMSVPPHGLMHHPPPPSGPVPQSPTALFNPTPAAFPGSEGQFYPQPPVAYPDAEPKPAVPTGQAEEFVQNPTQAHAPRRTAFNRRNSFLKHKPPCVFFPSGRCKNGDDCRFPHVMETAVPTPVHTYFGPRGGAPRQPRAPNHVNNVAVISQKMGNMTVRDDTPRAQNNVNGTTEGSSRSQSTDSGTRPKFQQGAHKHQNHHNHNHNHNGANGKRMPGVAAVRPQRVPSAEDFPVLPGGCVTPPKANGYSGPTAAQILSAPAPIKKEESIDGLDESVSSQEDIKSEVEPTAAAPEAKQTPVPAATPAPIPAPAPAPVVAPVTQKLPLSFAAAAAATAAAAAPETPKEVSVAA